MPSITRSVSVTAAPNVIWTILVRHLEHPDVPMPFAGKSPRIEPRQGVALTNERRGVGTGTKWSYHFRGKEYVWEDVVTEWINERKIAWKSTSGMRLEDYFELRPQGTTTTLRYHMFYQPPYGPLGAISERVFYRRAIIENIEWTLQVIKRNAERLASFQPAKQLSQGQQR